VATAAGAIALETERYGLCLKGMEYISNRNKTDIVVLDEIILITLTS
jgi:hypothetical protein